MGLSDVNLVAASRLLGGQIFMAADLHSFNSGPSAAHWEGDL